MAVTPWKPADEMTLVTKEIPRVDAIEKVTGRAKYAYDVLPKEALVGRFATCPYANAKAVRIDTSAAEALPGVKAIWKDEGRVCRFAGEFVAAVAAVNGDIADDAIRRIKIDWEPYPFVVREDDARKPGAPQVHGGKRPNVRPVDERTDGDVEAAFKEADAVVEGTFATQVQTHTCLEPHGVTAQWDENLEHLTVWASTQGISSVRDGLAGALNMDASKITVIMEYMGGGFGSKFGAGQEGVVCALLARDARQPVKLFMTRKQDQTNSGNRPSSVQHIRLGAKKDGTLIAFDMDAYGTGGFSAGAGFPSPYIYRVANYRVRRSDVYVNAGNSRAMRAPGHPQASFGMEAIMDELADALKMDPIELRIKNDPNETRRRQFRALAERIGWARRHSAPGSDPGPVKHGLGVGAATWGGGGGGTRAEMEIHPDGNVVVRCGTQDIGTGTYTLIAMVAGEELGLPVEAITPMIGHTTYPPSGGSGGSTTAASVCPAVKIVSDEARWELFVRVAPALDTTPDNLEAVEGAIRRKDDPAHAISWNDACAMLGTDMISVRGKHQPGLSSSGTAGVCGAEVAVDTETGKVQVVKVVTIQECGLVVDKRTTESQIISGVIQGISYALFEDRIMDRQLGHQINPTMEFYKVIGAADIPEIEPIVWMDPDSLARGVIGIGEPPVIPVAAAIGNAVKNALGVRVSSIPITPWKVLEALAEEGSAGA